MINIYVGNLPFSTTDTQLGELFASFGSVQRASVITDRDTGKSRGFGFVEMPNDDEGRKAIESLNGQEFSGRYLTVHEARRKPGG